MAQKADLNMTSLDDIIKLSCNNKAMPKQKSTTDVSKFNRWNQDSSDDEDESTSHGIDWKKENTRNVLENSKSQDLNNQSSELLNKHEEGRFGRNKKVNFVPGNLNTNQRSRYVEQPKQGVGFYMEEENIDYVKEKTDEGSSKDYPRYDKDMQNDKNNYYKNTSGYNYSQQSVGSSGTSVKRPANLEQFSLKKPRNLHSYANFDHSNRDKRSSRDSNEVQISKNMENFQQDWETASAGIPSGRFSQSTLYGFGNRMVPSNDAGTPWDNTSKTQPLFSKDTKNTYNHLSRKY